MADPASRMLRLLSFLQANRVLSGPELAGRLEVSERTVRRDVERLRNLGYPVDGTTGAEGGYHLAAGTAMPPLLLDDDEAVAIALGLRTAAGGPVAGMDEAALRALSKLEQVLPARLRHRVNTLQTYTVPLAAAGPRVDAGALVTMAQSCRDGERLRFGYRGRDGVESRREVEPHRLVAAGQRWYLVAWDRDRGDWRTFRVDRIDRPRPTGRRFAAHPLPAADPATFVAEAMASIPSRFEALVTLHAPLEAMARRRCPVGAVLEASGQGTCLLRAGAESLEWLALSIGMLGVDFEVHRPPELVEQVRAMAGRFGRSTSARVSSTPA